MHAIAGNLTPVGPRTGIETLEADTFRLECFQTPTGIKFLVRVAQLVGKIRVACSDSHARRCWQSRASRRWMRSSGKYTLSTLVTAHTLSLDIFIGPGARSGTNPAAKCEQEGYSESQAESAPDTNAGTGTKTLTRERTFT